MAYKELTNNNYRVDNARKTNSKKYPNGFIYILKLDGFDLYKIGVSNKPKRRIRDIQSCLPFDSNVLFCKKYKNVYELEQELHKIYSINNKRKEWFNLSNDDYKHLDKILNYLHKLESIKHECKR